MHLVPAERAGSKTIDGDRVCRAIAGLAAVDDAPAWAERFSILGDPGRLSLLLCMRRAGPIAVTDLAVATGISETGVSQALRVMRASGLVTSQRDGRVVRYRLIDPAISTLLGRIGASRPKPEASS